MTERSEFHKIGFDNYQNKQISLQTCRNNKWKKQRQAYCVLARRLEEQL